MINKLTLIGGLLATAFLVSTIVLAVLKIEVDSELGVCVEERANLIATCEGAAVSVKTCKSVLYSKITGLMIINDVYYLSSHENKNFH